MTRSKPNIIICMTDQQRWDTVYPYSRARTPVFNNLAASSTVFTHAFCPAPHCCPSRASFFTGLYPTEHGVWNNVDVGNALSRGLAPGVRTFSQDLSDNGYQCMFSGKWHISSLEGPKERGFNQVYNFGMTYGDSGSLSQLDEWECYYKNNRFEPVSGEYDGRSQGQILRPGYPLYTQYGYGDDPFGDRITVDTAIEMLDAAAGSSGPVCMFIGTSGPHDPYRVPPAFLDLYDPACIELPDSFHDAMEDKPNLYRRVRQMYQGLSREEHKESLRHYLALCSYEDYLFGLVLEKVRSLPGRTIIIYLSDHGDYAGDHGIWAKGLPCFESAYRVPLLIYDSDHASGKINNSFVSLTDIAPTILDLSGIPYDPKRFSGASLTRFLWESRQDQEKQPCSWREEVFTQTNGNELYGIQRSVRDRECLLVYNGFDFDEFYDLQADPHQISNQIDNPRCRDRIRSMYEKLWSFAYEHGDTCINPYIMVGLARYGPGTIFKQE